MHQLLKNLVCFHPMKSNKTLPRVTIPQILTIRLTYLSHLNSVIQFHQLLHTNFHHSTRILFEEQNWILSDLYNHSGIKHQFVLSDI